MKFTNKHLNDNSDEENEEENEELEEEQSQDDDEEDNEEVEDEEADAADEGEEIEDGEDFVENDENVNPNIINHKTAKPKLSLGGGNKKIILKKPSTKKTKFQKLVDESIHQLNERAGSSVEAMKKYILNKNPELDEKRLRQNMKRYIKNCVEDGTMIQIKRSFKLTSTHELKKKTKKAKAKNENQKDKKKSEKEKKKLNVEKAKEKKSTNSEKTSQKFSKVTTKTTKRTKAGVAEEAKAKPAKKLKVDKGGKVEAKAASSEGKKKTEKTKSKNKLGRKSINLVVRPTLPHPKSMKKAKSTAVAGKKEDTATKPASTAVKSTGKGKKK